MIRRPPRSTLSSSSAASDVYKRQLLFLFLCQQLCDINELGSDIPPALSKTLYHKVFFINLPYFVGLNSIYPYDNLLIYLKQTTFLKLFSKTSKTTPPIALNS